MVERGADLPVVEFATAQEWERWLARHHADSEGVWMKIAKRGSGVETVRYPEVLDVALCYGWIDGLRHKHDDLYFRQRFTPRKPRSKWSKLNRERVEVLTTSGRMRAAGLREVEAAKSDGRWDAAYEPQSRVTVPDDLARALRRNRKAARFFESLDSRNRFAILYRIRDAKRPETRARRIELYVTMLGEGRTIY